MRDNFMAIKNIYDNWLGKGVLFTHARLQVKTLFKKNKHTFPHR